MEGELEDLETLHEARRVIDDRLNRELQRREQAQARANAMLTGIGVLVALLVAAGSFLLGGSPPSAGLLSLIFFAASLVFVLKSIHYAVRGLRGLQGNRLTPAVIDEPDSNEAGDFLRTEIHWKRWEWDQLVDLTNQRLFAIDRSQRNLSSGVLSLLISAILAILRTGDISRPSIAEWVVILIVLLFVVYLDRAVEKYGLWELQEDA